MSEEQKKPKLDKKARVVIVVGSFLVILVWATWILSRP